MVGSGLRVDECLNLHFEDVELVDRQKSKQAMLNEIRLDDNSRYYLKIWVRKSKTSERYCKSVSSSYFAYKRLITLYKTTGLGQLKGRVWGVNSFREGLNSLLDEANLKTRQVGENTITRDSQSFRKTYMCMMINRKVPHQRIAQNCGTSTAMIDKFYAVYLSSDTLIDIIVESNSKD